MAPKPHSVSEIAAVQLLHQVLRCKRKKCQRRHGCHGEKKNMSTRQLYNFTQNWFDKNIPRWLELTGNLRSRSARVLEIGAFEGASTTWILDELLVHPLSSMISIDNFMGGIEHQRGLEGDYELYSLQQRFESNLEHCSNKSKHCLIVSPSQEAIVKLRVKQERFDLIYIDASHEAADVLSDVVICWPMLKDGGVLVFDDYKWDKFIAQQHNPKMAIDAFLACFAMKVQVLHLGYQVFVKKIRDESNPRPRSHSP
jgi:hypothetical protein